MNTPNKQTISCYIDTNNILIYQELTGTILQLNIPPEILSYLDVLRKEKLEQLLNLFIVDNKITIGNVILIYSPNTTFEKEFPESGGIKQDVEIQKFIDLVPFEDVLSKTYHLKKNIKVIAVNNRLYESIKMVFEKNKFSIYAVLPGSILQEFIPELSQNMDLGFILRRIDSLKQYSLINRDSINRDLTTSQTTEKKPEDKKSNMRIYLLGGLFGFLLIILGITIYISRLPENNVKKSGAIGVPPAPIVPKVTVTETSEHKNTQAEISQSISTPSGVISQPPLP